MFPEKLIPLPIWGASLILALVYGLVLYFERDQPSDTNFVDEHNPCVEELQSCNTESHTSERSCADARGECFDSWEILGSWKNQEWVGNETEDSALDKQPRDLQQCQMLLRERERELEEMRYSLRAIKGEVERGRWRQMDYNFQTALSFGRYQTRL